MKKQAGTLHKGIRARLLPSEDYSAVGGVGFVREHPLMVTGHAALSFA